VRERRVGDLPALAALAHHVALGHAHVVEEDLVEAILAEVARHRAQRPDLDAGRVHRRQDVADAAVLAGAGLRAHQHEDHVRRVRRARPDFLTVDDEVVAVGGGGGLQAGQVAARAGLGVALAPDHLAAHGGTDPALLLLLGAVLEKRGDQHRRPLRRKAAGYTDAVELLVQDHGLEQVGLGTEAPVLLRDRAGPVAVLDLPGEPGDPLFAV